MKEYSTSFIALQEAIKVKMHRERFENQFWGPMIGKVIKQEQLDNGQVKYSGIPSGNVIEMQDFFIGGANDGKDTVMIPMIQELEQDPGYGELYLVGTGEETDFKYCKAFVNQTSAVIKLKDGNMSSMRDKAALRSYRYHLDLLNNRMKIFDNGHIIGSIFEHHSNNVLTGLSLAPNGIGATAHLHPNLYANEIATDGTSGSMIAIGTEKRNKTAAQMQTAVRDDYADLTLPSSYLLEAAARKCAELHIAPVTKWGGKPLYLTIVDIPTFYQLRRDTLIKDSLDKSWTGIKNFNNPLFMYDMFVWDKFLIIKDTLTARSWDTTTESFSGTNGRFYNLPTMTSGKENTVMCIMGKSSVGFAIPGANGKLHFEKEITNFKQNEEQAGLSIYGAARMDWVEEDRVSTYFAKENADKTFGGMETSDVKNQSSLLIVAKRVA